MKLLPDLRAHTVPLGVRGTEHALTLVVNSRIVATAVATAWGWHISRGRRRVGPGHPRAKERYGLVWRCPPYRPDRCMWLTTATRSEAVDRLYDMGKLMAFRRVA